MKKKFQLLLTFLLIAVLAMSVVACSDYQKEIEEEKTETTVSYEQLITNGTFYDSSSSTSDKYILDTVSGWTQSNGSLATSAKGDSSTGVLVSALSLADETTFKAVTDSWKITIDKETDENGEEKTLDTPIALSYPGIDTKTPLTDKLDDNGKVVKENGKAVQVQQDTNALLIASTLTEGSLKVTGGSYTLAANSVYKLQFSVCSLIDAEDTDTMKGAWFIIRGDIDYEYECINTKNEWKTYELYIETNKSNSMSISLELWLGYGFSEASSDTYTKYNADKYATRGFALFDNIICTKLVDEADGAKEADFVTEYTDYSSEKSLHENYVNFAANVLATKTDKDSASNPVINGMSCYYLIDADMTTRSHDTTFRSDSYRKYFDTFRGYYTTSNLKNWSKTSDTTATAYYYGVVNASKLYNEGSESDLYSQYASDFIAMGYDNWHDVLMAREDLTDETEMLMLYNKTLAAGGFTHDDTIVIEKNTYYAISVWTYVWAKQYTESTSYNGKVSYFAPYSATSEPEKPADPQDKDTYDVVAYKLYELANAETREANAFPVSYFTALTTDEKQKADAYTQDITTFASAIGEDKTTLLGKVTTWLRSDLGLEADEVGEDVAEYFVYTYLYFCMNEYTDIVTTDPYAKATIDAWDRKDDIEAGYCLERTANIAAVDTMKTSVDTYKTKKASYDTSLAEYKIAKNAYDAACANWEQNNEYEAPYATIRLTGSGDGIEETTEGKLNEWKKVTIYVQGNQLSSRELTLNLLFGEGTDTTKHMIGGVMFDNVEIKEITKDEIPASANVHTLSEIKTEDQISFGQLNVKVTDGEKTEANNWEYEKNEGTASADNGLIKVSVAKDESIGDIVVGSTTYNLYVLEYKHEEATASTLVYKDDENILTINPNKCYRFAFLVKTEDIDADKGISITLLKGEKKEKIETSFNTGVSAYSTDGEWTEVAYYIRGDLTKTWYLTMKVAMGDGDRFDSDDYVKGSVKFAAFNCMEITYDEYTDASTGDKIVSSLSLYSISQDIDDNDISITNATYSTIDYSSTDKEEFDENGKLTGVGVPSGWTIGTAIANDFSDTVDNLAITDAGTLTWDAVTGNTSDANGDLKTDVKPEKYEIWIRYTEDGETVEKLYDTVDGEETEYDITASFESCRECKFAVKAIGSDGVSAVSSYTSGSLTFGGSDAPIIPAETNGKKASKVKAGTILVENVEGLYQKGSLREYYVSPYATALQISSDYNAAISVSTGSSNTIDLDAEGTYKISVWAKTEDGTKASIVLTSSNGSLYAEVADNIIGYKLIDTKGKWQEYCFYVKTKNFDVSLTANLCLGNPYATKKSGRNDSDEIEYYDVNDLSKGTVWFDAIRAEAIDEAEFKIAKDYNDAKTGDYATLQPSDKEIYQDVPSYIYMLEYTIDSFDASEESDEDGFGNEPNNYTHGKGSDFESADETIANEGYGVYDRTSTSIDMQNAVKYLYTSQDSANEDVLAFNNYFNATACADTMLDMADAKSWTSDDWADFINNFLKVNRTDDEGNVVEDGGRNVLVMSNKLATGFAQKYSLNSGYTYTMTAGKAYKFTFSASTLLAALTWTDATAAAKETYNDGNGTWASDYVNYYVADGVSYEQATSTYSSSTTYYTVSYSMADAYGELRFDSGEEGKDDLSVYISSYNKDVQYDSNTNLSKTYTIYIYNPEDGTDSDASWTFYLGDDPDNDDTTGFARYLVGMMAVDLVSVEEIDKDVYDAAKTAAQDSEGKIDAKSKKLFYEYEEEEEEEEEDDEEEEEEEEEESNFWEKLVSSDYFWLYISSFVLALIIIVVIIVFLIRRIKKKHPKKVKVQNVVKTSKDVQVPDVAPQEKVEDEDIDEYVDTPKPLYVQRTANKKKKK